MDEVKSRVFALETRLKLGLQNSECLDVYKAISTFHISCIKRVLQSNISGATVRANNTVSLILINSAKSLGHQNFTIAHELYHCLYDDGIQNRACVTEVFERKPPVENSAEIFAVHLLMPEDGVLSQLKVRDKVGEKLTVSDVVYLEQYFGVSRRAMCWRLEELKLISKQDAAEFSQNVIHSVRRLGKDTALYEPTNENALLSDYVEKANEAFEKELITRSRYEEILADAGLLDLLQHEDEPGNA